MDVIDRISLNFDARAPGNGPELLVLHGTAGQTEAGDLSWICDPKSRVSYHYLVGRSGQIYRLVHERFRAWHAGVSSYRGKTDAGGKSVNGISIGVAFANRGPHPTPEPYPPGQIEAGAVLCADIWHRRGLDLSRITTHAVVSPGRKTDPWDHFPLDHFLYLVAMYRFPPPEPFDIEIPRAA